MSTGSNNSGDSMPDESIEVIGPEDLEDSPPPAEVEAIGPVGDVTAAPEDVDEVEVIKVVEKGIEVVEAVKEEAVEEPAALAAVVKDEDPPVEVRVYSTGLELRMQY
jgi:hypothetical protein